MSDRKPLARIFSASCAIRERTADGVSVGRCWHYVKDGNCPRHGDVRAVQDHYARTGELTDERKR
jgi:hypothetical protein